MSFNGTWKRLAKKLAAENAVLRAKLDRCLKHPAIVRRPMPDERASITVAKNIGSQRVYLTMGEYENGEVGEVFLKVGKQGTEDAVYGWLALAISIGLQYGAPVGVFIDKFEHQRIILSSMIITDDEEFPTVKSIADWMAKRLRHHYQKQEKQQ